MTIPSYNMYFIDLFEPKTTISVNTEQAALKDEAYFYRRTSQENRKSMSIVTIYCNCNYNIVYWN